MSKLKDELIEIKDYLKKSKIYYKVVGSDKLHTITPTTYGFLKGKVFDLEKLSRHLYYVKDNISYIHFYKSLGEDVVCNTDCIRTTNPDTKVLITMDDKESYKFRVYAKDVTIKNEKDDEVIFNAEIIDVGNVIYYKGGDFVVNDASKTSIYGNPKVPDLTINSSFLEISNISEFISSFIHYGEDIKLNNINCNLLEFTTDAKNIEVQNSNIEETYCCSFEECVRPVFVNSAWKIETPLNYLDGTIGNSETGITITDETFSDKASLELARAYATYGLREFLNNVESNNELDISPKLEVIEERKKALKEEYDKQVASLEDKKDVIINGYQKRKVKNLVKKKEN